MSPNPGEPGHETRGWTHAICDVDYALRESDKGWAPTPHRVGSRDPQGRFEPDRAVCCYCGKPTRGIYVRQAASEVHRVAVV